MTRRAARQRRCEYRQTTCPRTLGRFMTGLYVVAEPFVLVVRGRVGGVGHPLIQILSFVGVRIGLQSRQVGCTYRSSHGLDVSVGVFSGRFSGAHHCLGRLDLGTYPNFGGRRLLLGNIIITGPCLAIPGRLIGMTLWDVWRIIGGNLLAALAMAAIVWSARTFIPTDAHVLIELAVEVCLGAAAYLFIVWAFRMRVLGDIRGILAARAGACGLAVALGLADTEYVDEGVHSLVDRCFFEG